MFCDDDDFHTSVKSLYTSDDTVVPVGKYVDQRRPVLVSRQPKSSDGNGTGTVVRYCTVRRTVCTHRRHCFCWCACHQRERESTPQILCEIPVVPCWYRYQYRTTCVPYRHAVKADYASRPAKLAACVLRRSSPSLQAALRSSDRGVASRIQQGEIDALRTATYVRDKI